MHMLNSLFSTMNINMLWQLKDGKVKDIDNALVITTGNGSYGYPLQERVAS